MAKGNGQTAEMRRRIDRLALRQTCSWAVASRSVVIAIVVGTVLNAINQGPELMAGKSVNAPKLLLTYAVPFFVASFGAWSAFRQQGRSGNGR